MKTKDDRIRQAQTEMDTALAKRARAKQMWEEAEEELIMAKIKMEDAVDEDQIRQRRNFTYTSARY